MRLDRYSGQRPKYRIMSNRTGADVDPSDCFALKRQDACTVAALAAYAEAARRGGDHELAGDVDRMSSEWHAKTRRLGDGKMPD